MYTREQLRGICQELLDIYTKVQLEVLSRVVDVDDNMHRAKEIVGKGKGAAAFVEGLLAELKKREAE